MDTSIFKQKRSTMPCKQNETELKGHWLYALYHTLQIQEEGNLGKGWKIQGNETGSQNIASNALAASYGLGLLLVTINTAEMQSCLWTAVGYVFIITGS